VGRASAPLDHAAIHTIMAGIMLAMFLSAVFAPANGGARHERNQREAREACGHT
jgi:hypothetical protein